MLQDGLLFLRRHLVLILIMLLLGGVGGVAYYVETPRTYRTWTTLELLGFNEMFMGINALNPQAGNGTYTVNSINLQTQLKLMQSPGLLKAVSTRVWGEKLTVPPAPSEAIEKLRRRWGVVPADSQKYLEEAIGMASATVAGEALPGTRIFLVGCESINPQIAAAYTNALATEYINESVQTRMASTVQTEEWLKSQLKENKAKLLEAQKQVDLFVRNSGGVFAANPDTLDDTKLKRLEADLSGIQADRIAKQAKYEMVKNAPPDSLPEGIENGALAAYRAKIGDLRRERALLLTTFTVEHPRVKALDAQIADLQSSAAAERETALQRMKTDYEIALHQEQLLSGAFARQSSAVVSQSDRLSQYQMLRQEVEMLQKTVNTLAQQANQAATVSGVPIVDVRVIDRAPIPTVPIKPSGMAVARISIFVSLVLGIGVGYVSDKLRASRKARRFYSPGLAPAVMQVPELGVIPAAGSVQRRRKLGTSTLDLERPMNGDQAWKWEASLPERALLADAIQNVLVSILHRHRTGTPRILITTSPGPREGKTTIAYNLAVAVAESGRTVLLIDADLRRPRLHEMFQVEPSPGLADLLKEASQNGSAAQYIRGTVIPNLSVLPTRRHDGEGVGQLFMSPVLGEALRGLKTRFDLIIVDTPPLLPFVETRLIARHSDGVVLVLRSEVTEHEAALASQRLLAGDGIPLLGTVLNHWKPEAGHMQSYLRYYQPEGSAKA
jgi:capsular exopolysaccharide synthesis family protein